MASTNPLPTKIKELRGTIRPDRMLESGEMQPELAKSIPVPPDLFDEVGKRLWYHLCTELKRLEMLTEIGFPQIEDYCLNYQLYWDAVKRVQKGKAAISVKGGTPRMNPYFKIMQDTRMAMIRFEDRWGLSPSTQTKIPGKIEKGDDFPEFDL